MILLISCSNCVRNGVSMAGLKLTTMSRSDMRHRVNSIFGRNVYLLLSPVRDLAATVRQLS